MLKIVALLCLAVMVTGAKIGGPAVRICNTEKTESDKCDDLKRVLIDNGHDNLLECVKDQQQQKDLKKQVSEQEHQKWKQQKEDSVKRCIQKIKVGEADVVVLGGKEHHLGRDEDLQELLWETYRDDDVIVALGDEKWDVNQIKNNPLDFDIKDDRALHSALWFSKKRGGKDCEIKHQKGPNSIKILRAKELQGHELQGKKLICNDLDFSRKGLSESKVCNFETGSARAVFGQGQDQKRKGEVVGKLNEIVELTGPVGELRTKGRIFGLYKGEQDVIFSDDTQRLDTNRKSIGVDGVDQRKLKDLLCDGNIIHL